jgi:hypothetical protein
MADVTNCCECVRSVRDKITLELDAIWTHLQKIERDARIVSRQQKEDQQDTPL